MAFASGHHHHLATPVLQHLEREVRRRAEPEQRDPVTGLHLGAPQRAVPDDARAQERRRFEIVRALGEAVTAKSSGTVTCVGVPAVDGPSGEVGGARRGSPRPDGRTRTPRRCGGARRRRPGRRPRAGRHPSPERVDHADDLVAGHDRQRAPARGRPRRRAGRCGSSRTRAHAPAPLPARARAPAARRASAGGSRSAPKRSVAARALRDGHLGHGTTKVASPLIAAPPDSTRVQSSSTSTLRSPASSYSTR